MKATYNKSKIFRNAWYLKRARLDVVLGLPEKSVAQ